MRKKRLLVFVMGKWSFVNAVLLTTLREQMPEWEVSSIDLLDAFKSDLLSLASSLADLPFLARHSLLDGGYEKTAVLYAPATSGAINRVARKLVERHRPDITLQTTTRFNAASGVVPHFTLTDITLALVRQPYRDLYASSERALNLLDEFQHKVFSQSTGVFTMGKYVRESLVNDYGVSPERALAVGAGPNIVLGERSPVVGSKEILYVGSDWVRKGGPILLEAFRRIRSKHADAVLNLVGPAPVASQPGVNAIGRVPFDQLHRYYTRARLLALPTRLEAFGNSFVEALHFGLPIVATRIGAIPEMVRDGTNGYTVEPGNVDALAEALDRLLASDELAARFGEASYRLAPEFTWGRTAALMRERMLGLASSEPPGARMTAPTLAGVEPTLGVS